MSPTLPAEVTEEAQLLVTVRSNLARLAAGPRRAHHDRELTALRDSLADEKLTEDIASVVEAMERTAALRAQQQTSLQGHADPDNPYFGHLVVDDDHGRRSVLIGRQTLLSDRIRIVDWRNAPISRIFYQYREGDEYEEVIAGRDIQGTVVVRRTVAISDGELRRVATDDHTWVRDGDGGWRDLRHHEARLAGGAGKAVRASSLGTGAASGRQDKHLPEIASLLDARQFELITHPNAGVVVIQGSAGSGKTTVGLHRIAYLHYHAPTRFRPDRMLVLVFSRALASYIEQVLPALGVEGVQVREYEQWAGALRRRHFRGLPEAYSEDTPAVVTRFKLHTVMLQLLDEVGRSRRGDDPLTVFEETLTDRRLLMDAVARWAPGAFSEAEITKVHRWCSDQHFIRFEGGGHHEDIVPTMDREDDTLLLRVHQMVRGPLVLRGNRPLRYHHVMIDEAQDLSPIEIAVVLETAGNNQCVTLAGDVAQRLARERDFQDWTTVLEALNLRHVAVSPLQVSYRSTRQIMETSWQILGPLAPEEPATTVREGAPVGHLQFGGMGEAVAWLAEALDDLMHREPTSYVALLAPDLDQARLWYQALELAEVPYLTLIDDQSFRFRPGIEVTDIRSSKGLEFDYVVVLGANATHFGDDDHARHLLHVGATRAAHQLWLVSTGRPSPLIPPGLSGLVDQ
ncbi:MAG: ATP-binding domain-containing protein [Myxococcota bacterium]|nr:ATP-binding domain-containing protein [Myxococcota bacterium]